MFYEPAARDRDLLPHDPFKAIIAPRPIGWISTLDADGMPNLAPYSFFNAVSDRPPIVMFSSDQFKDSATHAQRRGEFVWSMATHGLREQMNLSSTELPRGESEFAFAGLESAPSTLVAPPRVAASPAALECRVTQIVRLSDAGGAPLERWMVLGQVVGVHLDEAFVLPDGRVDTAAMRPIARGGYRDEYSVVDSVFHLERPD
ncbi:MAG: flavin reductase family protein [Microbacterium sp.]|uniref:flavin reductase family protein n=1 Tax=Microbacterium sp. TaxID=51671 RepID=UPI0039E55046